MLYHVGDSQHTQNMQINKVVGENEKCDYYFTEKTERPFWPTLYTWIWNSEEKYELQVKIWKLVAYTCHLEVA